MKGLVVNYASSTLPTIDTSEINSYWNMRTCDEVKGNMEI